jgi:FkbM family methyltransferase
MKKMMSIITNLIYRLYVFVFARPSMQHLNNKIFQLALHGAGYNNHRNKKDTGEEAFIKILSKFNPKVCIDVGANVGDFSRMLLEQTKADVIAFEPLPKAYEKLQEISKEYPERLIAINQGVGDNTKIKNLYFSNELSEHASFSKEINQVDYVDNVNCIKVPITKLDDFIHKNNFDYEVIDFLKIDTEGYEYEVLMGAKNIILNLKPKFIQIEFNWHQLFKLQSLYSLGTLLNEYKVYQLLPYGLSIRDTKKPESNVYHFSNFVFVRSDIKI